MQIEFVVEDAQRVPQSHLKLDVRPLPFCVSCRLCLCPVSSDLRY